MNDSTSQEPNKTTDQRESYAMRGSSTSTNWFAKRTAARDAAFFLPHLRSGMNLLDCGCGTGSITVGLAETVAPGQVVAIDNREDAIESAKAHAQESDVDDIRFEHGSIYELSFADGEFDAVFSHAVLEHLSEPVAALKEIYRVLKPGGLVGVRTIDIDGVILAPEDPLLMQAWSLVHEMVQHHGGNFKVGQASPRPCLTVLGLLESKHPLLMTPMELREATRAWSERVASEGGDEL